MFISLQCSPTGTLIKNYIPVVISFILFVSFLLLPGQVASQALDELEVAHKLQKTYEKAASLVADFNQTTTMKFSSRVRHGAGTMVFSKPGRMRWDYLRPEYQVLISDGETISMYFEKSRQMIVSNAKDYLQSDVTYSFFTGSGNILRDFEVSKADIINKEKSSFLIKLTPKSSHPHVSSIHAWVNHKTFLITRLQIIDHFETVTDLFFENISIDSDYYDNADINEELFFFMPPPGTEIVEQY